MPGPEGHPDQSENLCVLRKVLAANGHSAIDLFADFKKHFAGPSAFFQVAVSGQNLKVGDDTHVAALTYMGFDYDEKITVNSGLTTITSLSGGREIKGPPFEVIAAYLTQYEASLKILGEEGTGDFFSRGGALGHFGFESVKYIEPILENHAGSFQMAAKNTGVADVTLFLFRKILIFDHAKSALSVCVRAASESAAEGAMTEVAATLAAARPPRRSTQGKCQGQDAPKREVAVDELTCSMGREKYLAAVMKLKEHIVAGDIFQAVLSERFERASAVNGFDLFRVLIEQSPSAYQFYIEADEKTLLGASPEMLLSVKKRILETHPIAGTRPRGQNADEETKLERQLSGSTKENAEHLMLVDLARNDLGRISAPGKVRVGAAVEIKKFPGVMHLVTRVYGELKEGESALAALGACFPAGTLSGAPKIRAMQILSELEALPRQFYGGAVGLFSFAGDLETCIAIRCAEVAGGQIVFRAGAGIVADSRPDFEYEEILHKTRSLRQALALAEDRHGPSGPNDVRGPKS